MKTKVVFVTFVSINYCKAVTFMRGYVYNCVRFIVTKLSVDLRVYL